MLLTTASLGCKLRLLLPLKLTVTVEYNSPEPLITKVSSANAAISGKLTLPSSPTSSTNGLGKLLSITKASCLMLEDRPSRVDQ